MSEDAAFYRAAVDRAVKGETVKIMQAVVIDYPRSRGRGR